MNGTDDAGRGLRDANGVHDTKKRPAPWAVLHENPVMLAKSDEGFRRFSAKTSQKPMNFLLRKTDQCQHRSRIS